VSWPNGGHGRDRDDAAMPRDFDRRAGIDRLRLVVITDRDCGSPDVATAAHVVAVRASSARAATATATNMRLGPWPRGWLLNLYIYIYVPTGTVWSSCHVNSLEHSDALTVAPCGSSNMSN
jgi:hypothetical protein